MLDVTIAEKLKNQIMNTWSSLLKVPCAQS